MKLLLLMFHVGLYISHGDAKEDCFQTYANYGEFTKWSDEDNACRKDCRFYANTVWSDKARNCVADCSKIPNTVWDDKTQTCVADCSILKGLYYDSAVDSCHRVCDSCLNRVCTAVTGKRCECPPGKFFSLKKRYCIDESTFTSKCSRTCPAGAFCEDRRESAYGYECTCRDHNKHPHLGDDGEYSGCVLNYCRRNEEVRRSRNECQACEEGKVMVGQLCVTDCGDGKVFETGLASGCRQDCQANNQVYGQPNKGANFMCMDKCPDKNNERADQLTCIQNCVPSKATYNVAACMKVCVEMENDTKEREACHENCSRKSLTADLKKCILRCPEPQYNDMTKLNSCIKWSKWTVAVSFMRFGYFYSSIPK